MADQERSCVHSNGPAANPDCVSCWRGQAERCEVENRRLRKLVLDHGGDWLIAKLREHDDYWRGGTVDG